jgi:hypothetical protein
MWSGIDLEVAVRTMWPALVMLLILLGLLGWYIRAARGRRH